MENKKRDTTVPVREAISEFDRQEYLKQSRYLLKYGYVQECDVE